MIIIIFKEFIWIPNWNTLLHATGIKSHRQYFYIQIMIFHIESRFLLLTSLVCNCSSKTLYHLTMKVVSRHIFFYFRVHHNCIFLVTCLWLQSTLQLPVFYKTKLKLSYYLLRSHHLQFSDSKAGLWSMVDNQLPGTSEVLLSQHESKTDRFSFSENLYNNIIDFHSNNQPMTVTRT